MSKARPSKLDPHTDRLTEWFAVDLKPLTWVRDQLKQDGVEVSLSRLSDWWQRRQVQLETLTIDNWTEEMEEDCRKFNPDANVDQVRQFVIARMLKLGAAKGDHKLVLAAADRQLAEKSGTTKAQLEQARLTQRADQFEKTLTQKQAELSLSQRRVELLERNAANALKLIEGARSATGGITPETLERIERELKLL